MRCLIRHWAVLSVVFFGACSPGQDMEATSGKVAALELLGDATRVDAKADSLVGRWIAALGGMENYHRLQSARFTLHTEMYDSTSGRLRRTRPRYVTIARYPGVEAARIERWEGNDYIEHGWDGTSVWATLNGEALPDTAKDYREAAYVSGDVNYWIALPYKLRDPGVFMRYQGLDEGGRHVMAVSFGEDVGLHPDDQWTYYFVDEQTWPVEVTYLEGGYTDRNRTVWEDIRQVDGYFFASRRVHINENGAVIKVLRTSDLEINPMIDRAIFSRP